MPAAGGRGHRDRRALAPSRRRLSDVGDQVNEVVAATTGLHLIGSYRDADVAIDVFDNADDASVAARTGVPIS
jgi:hypothetical protein